MSHHAFSFCGADLIALPSGALWWPDERLLCASDLHLGKAARFARHGASGLPPYEAQDTLTRLAADLDRHAPAVVICLGDSFDTLAAADELDQRDRAWLNRLQASRRWIWIEGNHDPGPVELDGTHLLEHRQGPLTFRHIAQPGARGELSGHYHPKARVRTRARTVTRPAFLIDIDRVILPAYGTYTGGLSSAAPVLSDLMRADASAILTGNRTYEVPMPRAQERS